MLSENSFSGQHATILGFFKEREATQIRVGKEHMTGRHGSLSTGFSPNESRPGPDHRMSPAKNVQMSNQIFNFRMRPCQVMENKFSPGLPVCFQKPISLSNCRTPS